MTIDVWLVVIAVALVGMAALLASVDAALSTFSKARADELVAEGRSGATRVARIVRDPAPYINTALLLRIVAETGAVVLVAVVFARGIDGLWQQLLLATLVMSVVSYVAIGVGPRTLGRQNSERVAMLSAGPLVAITRILGPVPRMLIALGNALTPGKGFREGPFSSEAELRELVDLAEQSALIESGERQMIHSVFELGDTVVREVMVPRTDVVFIERTKKLRQAMSLALRSGYSRIPVTGDSLDDVVGMAYLKDITKRVFDNHEAETTERVESVMRTCLYVPDSKPAAELLREMQAQRTHVAIVVDEYGGTAGMVTIEDILEEIVGEITDEYDAPPEDVEHLSNGCVRISARFDVDDLQELFGVPVEDDDVDSVGGLMAKHLGKVPIAGSEVVLDGLRFVAEAPRGRRNRIGTVLVSRDVPEGESEESVGASASG
ncbi:hemolysin family protein [Mumia zhuanghuii]|jgi:CBS domain containing-hemolysin-like protein|uniref:HlyC/CorC family transporter n=1 Tax=Mumia zhuanghuii TaxID=2585211 RepID=A0A5C4MPL6_9ACTN|nr:hemolysin family protein [Mumia zhuanghuii]TNC31448.1 HlyC/CorC family transporter [Mumia zhuanghuii]TNC47794.1 HlyC/CorC family transporter [Mumia zhuanghuii]